jgi:hypothetical protein
MIVAGDQRRFDHGGSPKFAIDLPATLAKGAGRRNRKPTDEKLNM